jgi:hypothetical protein
LPAHRAPGAIEIVVVAKFLIKRVKKHKRLFDGSITKTRMREEIKICEVGNGRARQAIAEQKLEKIFLSASPCHGQ